VTGRRQSIDVRPRRRTATVALALGLALGWYGVARAQLYAVCPPSVVIFNSLKYGDFDFCRLHLRYRPGATDCLRIIAPTCNAFPRADQPVLRGSEEGYAERIVCPPGPPPPSCPSGFPRGGIPGR